MGASPTSQRGPASTAGPQRSTPVPDEEWLDDAQVRRYLERHLAGARAATALARDLRDDERTPGTARVYLAGFLAELQDDIGHLRRAMDRVPGPSLVERTVAAASDVALRVARLLPVPAAPTPPEGLELLAVGVRGKWLLWSCLRELEALDSRFRGLPLASLMDRAEEQQRRLIELRDRSLSLWSSALGDGAGGGDG